MERLLDIKDLQEVKQTLLDAGFNKTDWKDLGGELGLDKRTMEVIKADEDNINAYFTECLSKWLERADQVDERHGRPTMKSLVAALTKMKKKNEVEYIRSMFEGNSSEGNSSEGKKPAKSTRQKTDSETSAGNKDGGAKARASDEEPDTGPTPPQGESSLRNAKKQNPLSSFMCSGWIILPLCIVGVAIVLMIYLPSDQQMNGKVPTTATVSSNGCSRSTSSASKETVSTSSTDNGKRTLDIEDVEMVTTVLNKSFFCRTKWVDLGLRLGLLMPRLNVIKDDGGEAYKHLRKTIVAWLKGEDNVTSRTWQTLIDAVRETGDHAAAKRIPEKLKSLYDITL